MRSFAFVVTMLMACGGSSPPVQKPAKPRAAQQDCGQNGCDVKAAQQDCGSNGCDVKDTAGTATAPVSARTCETEPCANELTRMFNATQPKPCEGDPNCGGVTPKTSTAKSCDNPPNC
jgi:hypothetical protein